MIGNVYTEEMIEWLRQNVAARTWPENAKLFNQKFGLNINYKALRQVANRRKIYTGRTGCFEKGHDTWNKGKKGWKAEGVDRTWFNKGHIPWNQRPIGSERINKDGYIEIKVEEPNKWMLKHVFEWEKQNGPINTRKECLIFLDGDRNNLDLSNLMKIKRSETLIIGRMRLWQKDAELNKTSVNIAKIMKRIGELKRCKKKDK